MERLKERGRGQSRTKRLILFGGWGAKTGCACQHEEVNAWGVARAA